MYIDYFFTKTVRSIIDLFRWSTSFVKVTLGNVNEITTWTFLGSLENWNDLQNKTIL